MQGPCSLTHGRSLSYMVVPGVSMWMTPLPATKSVSRARPLSRGKAQALQTSTTRTQPFGLILINICLLLAPVSPKTPQSEQNSLVMTSWGHMSLFYCSS